MKKNVVFYCGVAMVCLLVGSCFGPLEKKGASNFRDIDSKLYESDIEMFQVDNSKLKTINIPQDLSNEKERKLVFSEVFDSVRYLRLDSTPDALLARVDQMEIVGDRYLLLDRMAARSLKAFDLEGNYLCSYGRVGRAQGEYIEPSSFSVYGGLVKIYDQYQSKLLVFTLDGVHVEDKRLPFICRNFFQMDDNSYIFHSFREDNIHMENILDYMLIETDSAFVIKHKGLYSPYGKYGRLGHVNMALNNSQLFIDIPFTSDTLYQVMPGGRMEALYHINYGKRKLSEELLTSDREFDAVDNINKNEYYICPGNVPIGLNDYLYFNLKVAGRLYYCIYNKMNNELHAYNVKNDNMTSFFFGVDFVYGVDNWLVGGVEANDVAGSYSSFQEYAKNNRAEAEWFISQKKQLLESVSSIKSEDNLILYFARLKSPVR